MHEGEDERRDSMCHILWPSGLPPSPQSPDRPPRMKVRANCQDVCNLACIVTVAWSRIRPQQGVRVLPFLRRTRRVQLSGSLGSDRLRHRQPDPDPRSWKRLPGMRGIYLLDWRWCLRLPEQQRGMRMGRR